MYFRNREIIELSNGAKHIVVENTLYEGIYYYYVCEVDSLEKRINSNYKIITTVSENGRLFVKTINGELKDNLKRVFDEKLGLE